MNLFVTSRPETHRTEQNYLLSMQIAPCAIRAHYFPLAATLSGCIQPENYSQ